jgi:pimeloyl-ACP methyl ester carboxylesterase
MEQKVIERFGKKIFYRTEGTGQPVMLLHGFGEDGHVWDNQVATLKKNYYFIIPDLPGSGQSDLTDDVSMEGMAENVMEILQLEFPPSINYPPQKIILVGHSMGGYVALAFAHKYQQYLSGLCLFHSTAYPDSEEKKTIRRKGIEFIRQHGAYAFLKTSTPNLFSATSKEKMSDFINSFILGLSNFSADALVNYYEAMMQRPDRTWVLKQATYPVCFMAGEADTAVPLQHTLEQCHLPALSYIHVLNKSGHMGMLEESAKSTELLDHFFQQTAII